MGCSHIIFKSRARAKSELGLCKEVIYLNKNLRYNSIYIISLSFMSAVKRQSCRSSPLVSQYI